jgi:hypothetical protein
LAATTAGGIFLAFSSHDADPDMARRLLSVLALAVLFGGCKKADPKAAGTPGTSSGKVAGPAGDDPPGMARWTDAQIEQTVREDLGFTSLTLKPESRDRYTGTGTDAAGKAYTVVVRYRPGEYRIDATAVVQPAGGHDVKSKHWCAEGVTPKWQHSGK